MESTLTVETTSELLRLVLPLMARHQVPVTPRNYAIWFDYVRADNTALKTAVDKIIESKAPFDQALLDQLYDRYIAVEGLQELEEVRREMGGILVDIQSSMREAGQNVGHYSGQLRGISDQVAGSRSLEDIKNLLKTLIGETRAMQESSKELRAHFDSKSAEIAALQQELQRERARAITDPLTGLPNRQALMDAMEAAISEGDGEQNTALIMLDIDHFKRVNDRYGHLIGDRVLRYVGKLLQDQIKGKTPRRVTGARNSRCCFRIPRSTERARLQRTCAGRSPTPSWCAPTPRRPWEPSPRRWALPCTAPASSSPTSSGEPTRPCMPPKKPDAIR